MNKEIKKISIALASDDNYAIPLGITIFSILSNKKNFYTIEFFILEDKINNLEKQKISEMVQSYDCSINFISVDFLLKQNFLPEIGHLKKISYARIFIPEIISRDKVLYLDTDIIVDGDLFDLFDINLNNIFAALNEPAHTEILAKKGAPDLKKYFNAGVLLIDIKKWKDAKISENALNFIKNFPDKIEYADQDALNYVCKNLWEEIDLKYNYEVIYNEPYKDLGQIITHYIGNIKPWHHEYPNCINKYKKYAQMSPWRNNWKSRTSFKKTISKFWMITKLKLKSISIIKKIVLNIKYLIKKWKTEK